MAATRRQRTTTTSSTGGSCRGRTRSRRCDRIKTFFVDQTQPASVAALAAQLPAELDLIIDDGLHSPNANIAVLTMALSKVKVGGWVAIEDIDRSALPIWQLVAATMPGNYRCALINTARALMFTARRIT
jgi:hypothetical protein